MSNNFNTLGRVGKDAVTRQAGNTTATGFSVASSVGWGEKQRTVWINCTIFGDRGSKSAQYIKRGNQIWVSGEISQREYEGKMYLELNVSQFDFAGKREDTAPTQPAQQPTQNAPINQPNYDDFDDSQIPF